jgi:hypothetical protein
VLADTRRSVPNLINCGRMLALELPEALRSRLNERARALEWEPEALALALIERGLGAGGEEVEPARREAGDRRILTGGRHLL